MILMSQETKITIEVEETVLIKTVEKLRVEYCPLCRMLIDATPVTVIEDVESEFLNNGEII